MEARAAPDDKAQRNFTDPDSRIMKTADGLEQAYDAQAAVDANSQVIVGAGLTNTAAIAVAASFANRRWSRSLDRSRARGFRQFLLRGLEQVRQEWRMVCASQNLLKSAGVCGVTR